MGRRRRIGEEEAVVTLLRLPIDPSNDDVLIEFPVIRRAGTFRVRLEMSHCKCQQSFTTRKNICL